MSSEAKEKLTVRAGTVLQGCMMRSSRDRLNDTVDRIHRENHENGYNEKDRRGHSGTEM